MSIIPEGEALKKAVKWISDERKENPDKSVNELVNNACIKFDIPPKDSEFLLRMVNS